MTSTNGSDEREFLQLAAKVLGGSASAEEKTKLEASVHANPQFRKTFEHMQALTQTDKDDHFLQTAIRVILNKATPEESKEIAGLKSGDQSLWRRYRFIESVFDGLAREAALGDTVQKEPMPNRVRSALAAKLRE